MENPDSLTKVEFIAKRELFAAMILQGLLSNPETSKDINSGKVTIETIIRVSEISSDKLINKLKI